MSRTGRDDEKLADLDELIRKIVDDAQGGRRAALGLSAGVRGGGRGDAEGGGPLGGGRR